ncbi:helix-turn-helix domain-containing protein [Alloalcanivorax profundimaris]|uniref:helix-turn-helix domain-containing protein n=1 Tax=Alloalcanivorax profundimaris TaxID=2735259 RepID=UPI001886EE16|nr:helix-turn-helix domain-containing protein [Alloalcanivorax profundimaris]MBF1800939.1 helix-turn-helix domain-containing protein [Alloalcanivorax profundimaris]MCQ6261843.1 helix-turn-helix domain-containing protein [Alcanivorax sp. MM125-6]
MNELTAQVSVDGLDSWRRTMQSHFLRLDYESPRPREFRARGVIGRFANSAVARLDTNANRVVRRPQYVKDAPAAYYKIFWQMRGVSRIQQAYRSSTLKAGMWSVYDTTREYSIESTDGSSFMVLMVPQLECDGWMSSVDAVCGRALDGRGAPNIVLSSLTGLLCDGGLQPSAQGALQDATVKLIESALDGEAAGAGNNHKPAVGSRFQEVKAFIIHHLADPRLSPDTVAATFSMSRRSLYNLFLLGQSTPSAFIHQERMNRARVLLRDPDRRDQPVSSIAVECGFSDPAHFSRAFRARFGLPPGGWRDQFAKLQAP